MQSLLRASPRLAARSLRGPLRAQLRCYAAIPASTTATTASSPLAPSRASAAIMPARHAPVAPFPTDGLLPKQTSQAAAFLEKFPEYDGRGVRVAILDTGVDPAAKGLDGKGKVVEVIDCTGSGDVYLTDVEPLKDAPSGTIALKSPRTGRTLLLASSLKNPSGKWKIGTQAAYNLWPRDLVARRKAERKKETDVEAARLGAQVQQALFEAEHGSKPEAGKKPDTAEAREAEPKKADAKKADAKEADAAKKQKDEDAQKRAQRTEELKAQLTAFKEMAGAFEDAGPIVEVVAWFDGSHWRAIVFGGEGELHDPTLGMAKERLEYLGEQTIDLTHRRPMADYGLEHHWEAFGEKDLMTYNVNFLHATADKTAEVEAVSIVCNSGSHATHVAGIVSADRKDDPSQNGVAPGAQIVSLCIGDGRLGSMETQQALLRAARAIIDTGCDVANMSFGESGAWAAENKGAFAEQLRDIVIRERDVLFVSSAGNSGPALSTLGQPAGTTTGILTVGAYVDAGHMQQAQYALVEEGIKSSTTTWCSRGPTFDGAKGCDIYSPGAAVTSIPRYCLQTTMLANGTSMSSPHAAGCVALLVSGMKAKGIPVTPARVFKAIRATAKDVKDPQGVGFFQVAAAWDYIVKHADRADADAEWRIAVTPAGKPPGRAGTDQRGIYLRNNGTHSLNQFTVTAQPTFKQNETERAQALQIGCSLATTASWVSAPDFVWIGSKGRGFEVRVDTTGLAPGLHVAAVEGYDSETGLKLFECPVTVAKPTPPTPTVHFERVRLDHGKVERRFVSVPIGATWAEMRFRSSNHETPGTSVRFWNHSVQMLPHARLNEVEKAFVLTLNENEPVTKKVNVTGGVPIELCLAQFWASAAGFDLEVAIDWHGISFATPVRGRDETTLIGGEGIARLECTSHVRVEQFSPAISLDQRRSFARPTSSELRPLTSPRDALPDGSTLCELILTYPLEIKEDSASVKYGLPLSNHLYDSAVPQLSAIFDAHKRRVHFSDVYSDAKAIDLSKGAYTVRVELLAAMPVLEKLRNMSLRVDTKLAKPVSLDVYEDHVDQYGAAKPARFAGVKLLQGETKVLCLDTNIEGDALPKGVEPGDVLLGTMTASGNEAKGQLRLVVPPAVIKPKPDEGAAADTTPTVAELMTGLVQKVPEAERDAYVKRLLDEFPDDLGVLVARLNATKPDDAKEASKVLAAAQAILDVVDEQSVLLYAGAKKVPATEQSAAEKQRELEQKKRRDAYVLALNRRARALLARDEGKASPEFEETFERYRRVADAGEKEYAAVYVRWAIQHERYGTALVQVRKSLKELGNGSGPTADEVRKLRALERELAGEKLGWHRWAANADRARVFESAPAYMPF